MLLLWVTAMLVVFDAFVCTWSISYSLTVLILPASHIDGKCDVLVSQRQSNTV